MSEDTFNYTESGYVVEPTADETRVMHLLLKIRDEAVANLSSTQPLPLELQAHIVGMDKNTWQKFISEVHEHYHMSPILYLLVAKLRNRLQEVAHTRPIAELLEDSWVSPGLRQIMLIPTLAIVWIENLWWIFDRLAEQWREEGQAINDFQYMLERYSSSIRLASSLQLDHQISESKWLWLLLLLPEIWKRVMLFDSKIRSSGTLWSKRNQE